MERREESEDSGETVELALTESRHGLPSAPDGDLRPFLPGLEADRQLTDWGRSERVEGLVDRTIYEFLYHYWFRVEVEGIENVPGERRRAARRQPRRRRPVRWSDDRQGDP